MSISLHSVPQHTRYLYSAGSLGNGVAYPSGSTVLRTDTGEGDAALQCTTDSTTCSNTPPEMRAGEFYFPNGSTVPNLGYAIYYDYGYYRYSHTIRLNRQKSAFVTGQFRCEIPSAYGTMVNLFINVGM